MNLVAKLRQNAACDMDHYHRQIPGFPIGFAMRFPIYNSKIFLIGCVTNHQESIIIQPASRKRSQQTETKSYLQAIVEQNQEIMEEMFELKKCMLFSLLDIVSTQEELSSAIHQANIAYNHLTKSVNRMEITSSKKFEKLEVLENIHKNQMLIKDEIVHTHTDS